jgi:putative ABC transport system permease protein
VREGLVVTALGVSLGVPLALIAATTLLSLLYGISEVDPVTFGAVTMLLLALGGTAGVLQAAQAARVNPMTALRGE